uniref:Cell adhesion molecule 4-like n=1 Tax=Pundamilia nyererei TaxID=303518 RepID=A0A3B4H550_9CICH
MNAHATVPPLSGTSPSPFSDLVTKIGPKGIVSVVLLLMICVIAVLMWCLSRHKGEYVTNEMEEKDEDADSGDGDSVGSDEALQSEEPLTAKEEK